MIPAPQIVPIPSSLAFPLQTYWKSAAHNTYLVVNGSKVEASKDRGTSDAGKWIVYYDKDDGFSFQSVLTGKFLCVELLQKISVNKVSNQKATKFIPEWHCDNIFILRCESGKYLGVDVMLNVKANRLPATSTEEFIFELDQSKPSDLLAPSAVALHQLTPSKPSRMSDLFSSRKSSSASGLPQPQSSSSGGHDHDAKALAGPGSPGSSSPHLITRISARTSHSPSIFSVGESDRSRLSGPPEGNLKDISLPPSKEVLSKGVFVIKACYPGKAMYVTLMPNGEVMTSPRPVSSWTLESSPGSPDESNLGCCTIKNFQRDDSFFFESQIPEMCSLKCGPKGTRFVISSFEFPWDSSHNRNSISGNSSSSSSSSTAPTTKVASNFFTIKAVLDDPGCKGKSYYLSFLTDSQGLNFVKSVDGSVSKSMLFEFIRIKTPTQLDIRTYPPLLKPFVPPKGLYPNM